MPGVHPLPQRIGPATTYSAIERPEWVSGTPASHTISAIARGCGDASARPTPYALPDYELLELVLFRAVPRRDTKPLAKAILAHFGSFTEALNAPEERLKEVPGLGEAAITEIKLVRAAALRLMRGEVLERPVLASWSQVLDYCRASMGFEAKAVPHPVPRQAQPDHRRRGAAEGHRRSHPGLCARDGEAGARAVGHGDRARAQSPPQATRRLRAPISR